MREKLFLAKGKKAALILAVVSLGLLIAKYQVLGDYYHAHSTVLKDFFHYYRQTEQLQAKPEGIINEQIMQTVTKYVQGQKYSPLSKIVGDPHGFSGLPGL
ncbi:MAG: hypothetical protein ACOX2X_01820 [Peptococcia bacterium]